MASLVGWSGRRCHRALREVIAFEPAAQGSCHFQHRDCSFLRPPSREGGRYAHGVAARNAQLGAVPALSCRMLCALRKEVFAAVGTIRGASKLGGRNITKYLHPRNIALREVVRRIDAGSRPTLCWGRPMTPWKKQA